MGKVKTRQEQTPSVCIVQQLTHKNCYHQYCRDKWSRSFMHLTDQNSRSWKSTLGNSAVIQQSLVLRLIVIYIIAACGKTPWKRGWEELVPGADQKKSGLTSWDESLPIFRRAEVSFKSSNINEETRSLCTIPRKIRVTLPYSDWTHQLLSGWKRRLLVISKHFWA